MDSWIPESNDVQGATGQYNRGNSLWILTHAGEKTTKSVGHDAKGILHHPSLIVTIVQPPGQPILPGPWSTPFLFVNQYLGPHNLILLI